MASSSDIRGYGRSLGVQLAQRLAEQGQFIFTASEAEGVALDMGISPAASRKLLAGLLKADWIIRLRRGLYAGTGRLPGGVAVHPWAIATAIVSPSAISHWTALNHHGLTTQIPRVVMVSTPKTVTTPSMRPRGREPGAVDPSRRHRWTVGEVQIEYVRVRADRYFGLEQVWVDERFRVPVTDRERTVLDLFAAPRMFGGIDHVLTVLDEHSGELDVSRLVGYAVRYGSKAVCARVGWSLARAGIDGDSLRPLEAHVGPGLQVLDPTRPRRGRRDSRWSLVDNVTPIR